MNRSIEVGDKITAWFNDGLKFKGVVENIPQNTGDLWYIRHREGAIYAINPSGSNLEGILKIVED